MKKKNIVIYLLLFGIILLGINKIGNNKLYVSKNSDIPIGGFSFKSFFMPLDINLNLTIDGYEIDEEDKIIYRIPFKTTVTTFLDNITTDADKVSVLDKDGNEIVDNERVHTNYILRLIYDEGGEEQAFDFKLSVLGDVNADGKINNEDFRIIANHIIDGDVIKETESFLAADYDGDKAIKINDITKLMRNMKIEDDGILTATFIIQNENAASSDVTTLSCDKEGNDSCNISMPLLIQKEGYEIIGWNTNKNAKTSNVKYNDVVTIYDDVTYYSITKKKVEIDFEIQDSDAVKEKSTTLTCDIYNKDTKCSIKTLKLTPNTGYNAIGWNTDKDAIEASINGDTEIDVTEYAKYYSITSKTVTVLFDKNIDYNKNIVGIDDESFDRMLTNIAADSLETNAMTCISYNNKGCYLKDIPAIYSKGNEILGFSKNQYEDENFYFLMEMLFKEDTTLYSQIKNLHLKETIEVAYTKKLGNVTIEFQTGLYANVVSECMAFLEELYQNIPELFLAKGKMIVLQDGTYKNLNYKNVENTVGLTWGYYTSPQIFIKTFELSDEDKEKYSSVLDAVYSNLNKYVEHTMVHELSHGLDYIYGAYTGNFNDNKIIDHKDIKDLYSEYEAKEQTERPLDEYAYHGELEFWAQSVAFVYYEKYHKDDLELINSGSQYNEPTKEIEDIVHKYICIAKNNFNEEAKCS